MPQRPANHQAHDAGDETISSSNTVHALNISSLVYPEEIGDFIRLIASHTPDHILVQDTDLRYRLVINPQLGLTEEEMLGRTDDELLPPQDAAQLTTYKRRVLDSGNAMYVETSLLSTAGARQYFEGNYVPWKTRAGEIRGLIGYFHNVTRRYEAEHELKLAMADLHESQRIARLGTYRFDVKTSSWSSTKTLDEILGISPGFEKKGFRSWDRLLHPEDRERILRTFTQNVLGAGQPLDVEYRIIRPVDGREIWVHGLGNIQKNPNGEVVSMLGTVQDITERKRIEEQLRVSEERLRLAAKATNDVIWDWDAANDSQIWSNTSWHEFGWKDISENPQTIGWWTARLHPEDKDRVMSNFFHRIRDPNISIWKDEYRFLKSDGTYAYVVDRAYALRDERGVVRRVVGAMRDVSDAKRIEQALTAANEQLLENDRRKNEFLSMLSHELRNPLAPIQTSVEILERSPTENDFARRMIAVISRQVQHLSRMVEDLLDVTRIAQGKIVLHRKPFDLCELVEQTAGDHRNIFGARGITFDVTIAPGSMWMNGDRTRIAEILGNLLTNAAKFTAKGGRTHLSLYRDAKEDHGVVRVEDNGQGIAPELLSHLFEPFTQADRSLDRSPGGLGLGLSVVKGLVELHGGTVNAFSDGVDRGATFTVTLPLVAEPAPSFAISRKEVPTVKTRVLIIEDNLDAAEVLREALGLIGFEAELSHTGPSGLEKAIAMRPEVVLCDIGLPGIDGYQVAKEIRAHPELAQIRLVAMSGYAGPNDVARAMQAGFDVHLAKPASMEDLERALRQK